MTSDTKKTDAEGSTFDTWCEVLWDGNGCIGSLEDLEKGVRGADLMPIAEQLAGAGPTGGCAKLDLMAMVRRTNGLPRTFVTIVEHYVETEVRNHLLTMANRARYLNEDIRDRVYWHAAHAGFDRYAEALFAMSYKRGTALQRVYAHGLLTLVARRGESLRWKPGCDVEILREGFQLGYYAPAMDIAVTQTVCDYIMSQEGRKKIPNEWSRIHDKYRFMIPRSLRELAEENHDHMTRRGHWEPRQKGEYDHLSNDWRSVASTEEARPSDVEEILEAAKASRAADVEAPADPGGLVTSADPGALKAARREAAGDDWPAFGTFVVDLVTDKLNELHRAVEPIVGKPVELVAVPDDVDEIRAEYVLRYPHAVAIVDRLIEQLKAGAAVRIRPTLIVGSPGCGKTTMVRDLMGRLGVPVTVYPCATVGDGSFGGTPAQWSTRRLSTPMAKILQSRRANPAIVLDEIEKTGSSTHNGSLLHALLPMLEQHSAQAYFEVGIETPVDLSYVSFIATANDLATVPSPLLDRLQILRMPDPGPEHLDQLVAGILADVRSERMVEMEWMPDLAPDELATIRKIWPGGSLRRLRRAVDATLEAREQAFRARPN